MFEGDCILPMWARVRILLYRLGIRPRSQSADHALELIAELLHAIEDEFSGVPYNPAEPASDGRMYPPRERYRREDRFPGVRCYRQTGHTTLVAENGAIQILERYTEGNEFCEAIVFSKEGSDGRSVEDYESNP